MGPAPSLRASDPSVTIAEMGGHDTETVGHDEPEWMAGHDRPKYPSKNIRPQIPKKNEVSLVRSSAAEYLTFVAATGNAQSSVEMRYEIENLWLTQKMMATLYDVSVPAVSQHLKRIYADNEPHLQGLHDSRVGHGCGAT